jgi:hypothetical protein
VTGIGIAQEQPVLFPKSGGPNGVFHEIVVYLDSAIFETDTKQGPVGQRIIDGLAKSAARQIAARLFEEDQSAVQVLADRTTLAQAHSGPFRWTCLAAAQVLLDAVEMSDLAGSHPQRYGACSRASWKLRRTCAQHPARVIWRAWVLTKLPWPRRRRALQGALEVRRDHILEAVRSATGFPVIGHIPPGDNAVQSGQVWFGPSPETDNESESKDVGWLKCFCGYANYHGVPTNSRAVNTYRGQLIKSWYRSLRWRSQKRRIDWRKMTRLLRRWIPANHICHAWPHARFDAKHSR